MYLSMQFVSHVVCRACSWGRGGIRDLRVSTDGGFWPADGVALRAREFPSPWCSVVVLELMFGGRAASALFCCTFHLHPFLWTGRREGEKFAFSSLRARTRSGRTSRMPAQIGCIPAVSGADGENGSSLKAAVRSSQEQQAAAASSSKQQQTAAASSNNKQQQQQAPENERKPKKINGASK